MLPFAPTYLPVPPVTAIIESPVSRYGRSTTAKCSPAHAGSETSAAASAAMRVDDLFMRIPVWFKLLTPRRLPSLDLCNNTKPLNFCLMRLAPERCRDADRRSAAADQRSGQSSVFPGAGNPVGFPRDR